MAERGRCLWIDASAGASGDMLLGALLDLGAPLEAVSRAIGTDLTEVETIVDDLDPRVWPAVLDALVQAGAVDAWLTPVVMRKGRTGNAVTALVGAEAIDAVTRAFFSHSTTLGVRMRPVARRALPRDEVVVRVEDSEVRVKRGLLDGEPVTVQAEYADAATAAGQIGIPVRVVLERAAALARGVAAPKPEETAHEAPGPERGAQ